MIFAVAAGNAALITFLVYMLAVFGLAILSNRLLASKNFLSEYFLGSRGLGVWAFALTFAATAASGGSFTGFPSKIYTHGWVLALWIASYMVVPICGLGFMGKRINQVARISGAITVPDVIRDRFRSPMYALLTVLLIVFFISVNLVAQFKSGALILKTLLADVPLFTSTSRSLGTATAGLSFLGDDPQYLLCLFVFGIAVVAYTTYGGFHAVVWTDVMQGIVMVLGVLLMVPLTLWAVGGLDAGTAAVAEQVPPVERYATVTLAEPVQSFDESLRAGNGESRSVQFPKGTWFRGVGEGLEGRVFRAFDKLRFSSPEAVHAVRVLEVVHAADVERVLGDPDNFPIHAGVGVTAATGDDVAFGTITITWPEPMPNKGAFVPGSPFQAPDGRVFDFARVFSADGGTTRLEGVRVLEVPGAEPTANDTVDRAVISDIQVRAASEGSRYDEPGQYVTGPGAQPSSNAGFLPLSIAISFFFMWAISGSGQPHYWVRLMAFKDAITLRRSIIMVAFYYSLIYLPLVVIFVCARVLLPGMEAESDRIMPAMAVFLTDNSGVAWLAGLLVAAPFAAVMSTVDSVLLVVSSALVRDVYQRNLNPDAEEKLVKRLTYVCTFVVGAGAMIGAINPPRFLQDIIVYTGSGLASCFLAPMIFALYWPRVNKAGAMAGMLAGFGAHLTMYVLGIWTNGSFFKAYQPFGVDPVLVGLITSFVTVPVVSLITPRPPVDLVRRYFCRPV